jgi:hypothetical protein
MILESHILPLNNSFFQEDLLVICQLMLFSMTTQETYGLIILNYELSNNFD